MGDFYFTTSCATGLSVDENTGACVPNPKNAGATPDGTCVGNPINAGAATKYQIEIDVTSGLEFSRSYNSRMVKGSSDIGTNWRHSYLRTVSLGLNGDTADVYRSDGKTVRFMLNGTNWVADPDISDRLEQLAAASGWRYILAADNSVETYDATGKLLTLTDRAGHTQTLSYDTTGQLTAVTDAHGRSLVFTHDTADRIATLTDPAGGVTTYTYDANNNLASVTYPDATGKTYHYEDPAFPHALTGISDENGARYATYAYDAQGRAILSEHAGSAERVELTYNPDGSTTVTDALGSARSYNFETHLGVVKSTGISQPGGSGCGAASSAITYDANGNPASRDDFNGHRTRYWHDQGFATPRNLETTRVEGLAVENGNETVKPETRTIYTEWHPVWRLPTVEKTYTGGADAQGVPLGSMVREINATYDASGNLLVRTERDSQRSESRTWTYTWHSLGRLARIDGPRTDVQDITTYSYYPDDDPDLGRRGQLWQTTNALGHITEIQAYDLHGHPTRVRDPNNLITDYTYTARGWLNTRSAAGRLTSYTYDPAGQLTRVALPNGASLEYTYDAAHRLTGIRNAWNERIQYQLDAQGNILTETVFDAQGMQSRKLDRQYDALGRLWKDIRRVNGQDATTEYGYDAQGNRTLLSAPLSLGLRTRYDALDRLAGTEDAMMGEPGLGYTRLDRNALDAVTTFIDTNRTATAYEIDAYGQVRKETSPDRGDTTYTYDPAGNLKTRTDARGKTITYSHDALDRPTRIDRPNGTDTVFTWDMSPVSKGRLDRMQDEAGDTNWSYNPHGEVIGKTQTGLTRSVGYTYQNGNLTRLAYPSGAYVDYIWSQGRITDVRLNGAPLLSGIRYQAFGEPTGWTWSNGQSYSQGHDSETGWPQSYPLGDRNRSLSYDAGGRISGYRHDGQPNLDHDFGYDILDRLTDQSTYQGSTGWDYDPNGNRSLHRSGSATYLYDYTPFTNRLQNVSGPASKAYQYDAAGNPTHDGTYTYAYNDYGRLERLTWNGQTTSYLYNGLGERTRKTGRGTATGQERYIHDENGNRLGEYTATGTRLQETVWLHDRPVAVLTNTGTLYVYTDHLNTPRVLTDTANKIVWRWDADAYGVGHADEDPDGNGIKVNYSLRFPGQHYDSESGLHYNHHRYYSPNLGRYMSADPIGLAGGMNLFGYARQNPLSYIDPLGLAGTLVINSNGEGDGSSGYDLAVGLIGRGVGNENWADIEQGEVLLNQAIAAGLPAAIEYQSETWGLIRPRLEEKLKPK